MLPNEIQEGVSKQINDRFEAIAMRAQGKLAKEFPAVAADSGKRAGERVKAALTTEGTQLRDHVQKLATEEREKLAAALAKFPVSDTSNVDQDRLMRLMVHNLIMLADYELLSGDTGPMTTTGR
jgi:hypothetical protein